MADGEGEEGEQEGEESEGEGRGDMLPGKTGHRRRKSSVTMDAKRVNVSWQLLSTQ